VVHRHRSRPHHVSGPTASTPSCARCRMPSRSPARGEARRRQQRDPRRGHDRCRRPRDFAPGLARGEGGRAPQLLVAETAAGDYAFLDVTQAGLRPDRPRRRGPPVAGAARSLRDHRARRLPAGRDGVPHGLLRDAKAKAVPTCRSPCRGGASGRRRRRPASARRQGRGRLLRAVPLVDGAMRGSWTVRFYADPKAHRAHQRDLPRRGFRARTPRLRGERAKATRSRSTK
jgi:hypothetical protein